MKQAVSSQLSAISANPLADDRKEVHHGAGAPPKVMKTANVWQAISPAGGLSSPPGGLKGRLQPGLAATRSIFNRADTPGQAEACPTKARGNLAQ